MSALGRRRRGGTNVGQLDLVPISWVSRFDWPTQQTTNLKKSQIINTYNNNLKKKNQKNHRCARAKWWTRGVRPPWKSGPRTSTTRTPECRCLKRSEARSSAVMRWKFLGMEICSLAFGTPPSIFFFWLFALCGQQPTASLSRSKCRHATSFLIIIIKSKHLFIVYKYYWI